MLMYVVCMLCLCAGFGAADPIATTHDINKFRKSVLFAPPSPLEKKKTSSLRLWIGMYIEVCVRIGNPQCNVRGFGGWQNMSGKRG